MKISINWLKEYVDLRGISAEEIADKLTKITCEVEEIEHKGRGLDKVVVGKILTCDKHPKSDHLHCLTVDIAKGKPLTIVCGAPNARAGLYVAVATIGASLPNGLEIQKTEIRGEQSHGMCCSYDELGYKGESAGIIELPENIKIGDKIANVLIGLEDSIIDIDNKSITNRPDLWGHYGIARELSVIFDRELKPINLEIISKYDNLPKLDIQIENDKCLSYGAIKIQNLGGVVSPDIIQNRLYYLGHNSHGFLVDLTNYVMLLHGNPVHSFDAKTIDKLSIGNIKEGQKFVTLKDNEIVAGKEMLFIKSNKEPVALAGIMGGKDSEIKEDTQDAVFEIATFDASNIRQSSAKLGIRTDASTRYEKALDPQTNYLACAELLNLINTYAENAKVVSAFTMAEGKKLNKKAKKITVNKKYLETFTGINFAGQYKKVEKNLKKLGFAPVMNDDEIVVTVPTYRSYKDVTTVADVIEEITRNYGYENIVPVAPNVAVKPIPVDKAAVAENKIKGLMALKYAFNEVHTHIWYDAKSVKSLGIDVVSYLTVVNPFVKSDDKVRSDMLTSMLSMALVNKGQASVFEIGRVVNQKHLEEKHFSGVTSNHSYKEISEMLVDIFGILGMRVQYELSGCQSNKFHPVNNAVIIIDGKKVGQIGIIHPRIFKDSVGFEVNLSALDWGSIDKTVAPVLSKFPKVELDFTFVYNGIYSDLDAIFSKYKNALVIDRKLSGIYENKYTLTFTLCSMQKTLEKEEIGNIHKEIIDFASGNGVNLN